MGRFIGFALLKNSSNAKQYEIVLVEMHLLFKVTHVYGNLSFSKTPRTSF